MDWNSFTLPPNMISKLKALVSQSIFRLTSTMYDHPPVTSTTQSSTFHRSWFPARSPHYSYTSSIEINSKGPQFHFGMSSHQFNTEKQILKEIKLLTCGKKGKRREKELKHCPGPK